MTRRWHLVSYDVSDPRRLRRTAKVLEGYGQRIQFSVFRCRMSDRQRERLRWELGRVMADEDSLVVIPLCPSCGLRATQMNSGRLWPEEHNDFEIL